MGLVASSMIVEIWVVTWHAASVHRYRVIALKGFEKFSPEVESRGAPTFSCSLPEPRRSSCRCRSPRLVPPTSPGCPWGRSTTWPTCWRPVAQSRRCRTLRGCLHNKWFSFRSCLIWDWSHDVVGQLKNHPYIISEGKLEPVFIWSYYNFQPR
jgi:hypothetical protein